MSDNGLITVEWSTPLALDAPDVAARLSMLDDAERDRVARFARQEDRARFVTGRMLLRTRAAAVLGLDPADVRVELRCPRCGGPHGKPQVAGLEASVSHAADRVVLAWRRSGPVGVDVERRQTWPAEIDAGDVLAPGEDAEDLLATWVRKEAVLKLRGTGLMEPMTGVRLDDPAHHLTAVDLGEDYVAVVAAADPAPIVTRPAEIAKNSTGRD
ncbi:4'-phosphopantetheinyl transferase family protein [Nocardioides sp. GXZ039]|uniref:4'-phosphopantetheinyl transferase family protein n=1 Tax=Nocardioides sp. GXZ039 TaxID=3136018 RepID=UPI0030F3A32A